MSNEQAPGQAALGDERQVVVFRLAESTYGIDIHSVREIIRLQEITPVPDAPEYIEGVTNLRGTICPVMDLRRRFEIDAVGASGDTRIVVLEIDGEDVGVIVDAVAEVLRVPGGRIEPRPLAEARGGEYQVVEGIVNLGQRLIVLLDVGRLLTEGPDGRPERMAA